MAALLYLPSYSPDYNAMEQAIAKVNGVLRAAACRGVHTAIGWKLLYVLISKRTCRKSQTCR